eukprot:792928-Pelagomonas_calceolata.AAC.1
MHGVKSPQLKCTTILHYFGMSACGHSSFCLQYACSVWTVDLAHLARSFGLGVEFTSLMLGPNPLYKSEKFYMEHIHVGVIKMGKASGGAMHGTCCCFWMMLVVTPHAQQQ